MKLLVSERDVFANHIYLYLVKFMGKGIVYLECFGGKLQRGGTHLAARPRPSRPNSKSPHPGSGPPRSPQGRPHLQAAALEPYASYTVLGLP